MIRKQAPNIVFLMSDDHQAHAMGCMGNRKIETPNMDALAAFGCDFIRSSAKSSQPFCLSISFKAPHAPHNQIDPEDQERYAGKSFSRPPNWGREMAELLPIQPKLGRQYYLFKEWENSIYDAHIKAYYQLISGIDAALWMIRRELE
ncbi:MAG: hypothetical protein ACOCZS_00450 [Verrucomicrobiota bacterium]